MTEEISARHLLFQNFGVQLPIAGGVRNSIENAVMIQYGIPNNYVSMEYLYLKYIGLGRGISWKTIGQEYFERDRKHYDKITIEVTPFENEEPHHENYYFDITDCFGK
jgi:hypothetical protein